MRTYSERLEKDQKDFKYHMATLSNLQILEDTIDLGGGDDYDGCFTTEGQWKFKMLKQELTNKLIEFGFLNKNEKLN